MVHSGQTRRIPGLGFGFGFRAGLEFEQVDDWALGFGLGLGAGFC